MPPSGSLQLSVQCWLRFPSSLALGQSFTLAGFSRPVVLKLEFRVLERLASGSHPELRTPRPEMGPESRRLCNSQAVLLVLGPHWENPCYTQLWAKSSPTFFINKVLLDHSPSSVSHCLTAAALSPENTRPTKPETLVTRPFAGRAG